MKSRCQVCQNKESTLRIMRLHEGEMQDVSVCPECALQVSPFQAMLLAKRKKDATSTEDLLKALIEKEGGTAPSDEGPEAAAVCSSCGLAYERYKQTYMLGCAECYDEFGELLLRDLQKIHGSTEHVPGAPPPARKGSNRLGRLRMLRLELEEAVGREDFAEAAKLRDAVRALEQEQEEDEA
jgi:protein arginine kinase activator